MHGTISAIARQKRDAKRASIFFDGEFAFGVHERTIEEFRLRKGDVIDEERYYTIVGFDNGVGARRVAERYINHRARSEHEVRQRLLREEFDTQVIEEVIAHLRTYRLIDDEAWAHAYVNDRLIRKQVSAQMLERELRRHHILPAIITETLVQLSVSESDSDRARKALKKCWLKYAKLPYEKQRTKSIDYLLRRGFGTDVARNVFDELMNASGVDRP